MPSNPYDAKGLLIASIENNDPVIFLEPKRIYNGPFNGHHDQPVAALRHAVIGTEDDPFFGNLSEMKTLFSEISKKVVENGKLLELGDILHAHNIWFQLGYEPLEFTK